MHIRTRTILGIALLLLATQRGARAAQAGDASAPSTAELRLSHFQHGINLSDWFAQVSDVKGYTQQHFENTVTPRDLAAIQAMGFDHVRLLVDPRPLLHAEQPDNIASDQLGYLDSALQMILDHGLGVEITIYADSALKQRLATSDDAVERFADFWRALAAHFSALDPDRVLFEVLNEPESTDRYRWYGVEAKVATAIREGAPRHTIIATGAHYSDDDDLVFLEPLRDPNVVYAFHFYESHLFTHQGAIWSVNFWHYLQGVPYPSNPTDAARAAAAVPDAVNRLAVVRYGLDHWDAQRIDAEIGQVDDWAKHWNVPVICNEFGVYRPYAPPKDRAQWITDVRTALERHGIGWAMWDYDSGFGIVTRRNGQPVADPAIVRALGRTPVPSAAP